MRTWNILGTEHNRSYFQYPFYADKHIGLDKFLSKFVNDLKEGGWSEQIPRS